MAHIGFTCRASTARAVSASGRGDAAEQTIHDAIAVAEAGAFAVVMEMVPPSWATQITGKLTVPTVGIGAGPNCDAQVLVWRDMAGLATSGKTAKFVKRFGDVGSDCAGPQRNTPTRRPKRRVPRPGHSLNSARGRGRPQQPQP